MWIRTRRLQNNRWSCVILFHNHSQIPFSVNISFTLSPSQRTPCWTSPRKKERKEEIVGTSLISCWSELESVSSSTLVKVKASSPAIVNGLRPQSQTLTISCLSLSWAPYSLLSVIFFFIFHLNKLQTSLRDI